MLEEVKFILRSQRVPLLDVLLVLNELQTIHVKRNHSQRCPAFVLLVDFSQLDCQSVFLTEYQGILEQANFANDDIQSVVSLFERVESVAEDGVYLFSLVGFSGFKCQVSRPSDLICQQVVVEFDLSIHFEILSLGAMWVHM